jgi:hypothetical protein
MQLLHERENAEHASGVDDGELEGVAVGVPDGDAVAEKDGVGVGDGAKAQAAAAAAVDAAGPAHSQVVTLHRDAKGAAALPGAHTPSAEQ